LKFELTVLGTSSALPTSKRNPTAHLLNVNERFFLIDCGEGTQLQLRKLKKPFNKISHIFLSHLHGDHIFGIFGLLSTYALLGRRNYLNIYAPKDFSTILDFFYKNFGAGVNFKIQHIPLNESSENKIFENKSMEVFSFPVRHRTPTWGFLFKEKDRELNMKKNLVKEYNIPVSQIHRIKKGADYFTENGDVIPNEQLTLPPYQSRSYAYITDTIWMESLTEMIKGVDLLYHEATFLEEDKKRARETCHSTARQAAIIAKKAQAGKLILGHFSARYKKIKAFEEEAKKEFYKTYIAEDGDIYEVPLVRAERK
jgi:ribonuclease Z